MHSVPTRARKDDRRTRYEQYGPGHPYCCLPDIDGVEWVASAFSECGMAAHGMAGLIPLSWAEVESYGRITMGVYGSWALTAVREMSDAYVRWHHKGAGQKDIANDVPYIERNEDTLEAAKEAIIRSREASRALREELNHG